MTKANTLLKKASLYEKLALYGRRQDFLKVIAQDNILPQEAISATKSAIDIINRVINGSAPLDLYTKMPYALSETSDLDTVQGTYNNVFTILKQLYKTSPDEAKRVAANKLLSDLSNASNFITKARQWGSQQQSILNDSTKQDEFLKQFIAQNLDKEPFTETAPSAATDPVSVFNFFYAKLQQAYTSDNLKEMMSFFPKLQGTINKLDNPYSPDYDQALVQKGNQLVLKVKQKLGMA